jgi:trans-aconitate methyltransferase
VADVGCGHGASTIVMAQAYPNSEFFGFDYHKPSIERAKVLAQDAGVGDRITFAQASAKDFRRKTMIWWRFSNACMTWATPSVQASMSRNAGQGWVVDARRAICP